jgi:hypothetical protein
MDAVLAGLIRARRRHATSVAAFGVGPHDDGLAPVFGVVPLLDGREERVHVHVDYYPLVLHKSSRREARLFLTVHERIAVGKSSN